MHPALPPSGAVDFDRSDRVLACDACDAPMVVPAAAGLQRCPRCEATMAVPARPDTTVPATPAGDERGRRERLRRQQAREREPTLVDHLLVGGKVPAARLHEALRAWSSARRQLRDLRNDDSAAQLVTTALTLRSTLARGGDTAGARAVLESTLEVLALPRQRQILRCALAREAARAGAVELAERWLDGCDPGSEDLEMDGAYRVSRALVHTARREPQLALQVLGENEADVPVDRSFHAMATVLRAHAFEQLGNVPGAKLLIVQYVVHGPPVRRRALKAALDRLEDRAFAGRQPVVEEMIDALPPEWHVCAQAMQLARRDLCQRVAERKIAGWLVVAASLAVALVLVLGGLVTGELELPMLLALPVFLAPAIVGLRMIRRARRAKLIARTGLPGRGRVVSVERTMGRKNDVAIVRLEIEVHVESRPSVRVAIDRGIGMDAGERLVDGQVGLVWHPEHPHEPVLAF